MSREAVVAGVLAVAAGLLSATLTILVGYRRVLRDDVIERIMWSRREIGYRPEDVASLRKRSTFGVWFTAVMVGVTVATIILRH